MMRQTDGPAPATPGGNPKPGPAHPFRPGGHAVSALHQGAGQLTVWPAATELGCDITGCLVIEDSPAGIQAGRSAGAHTLAVATTHTPAQLLSADAVVADLASCTLERTSEHLVLTTTPDRTSRLR
jgi:hypothetical protein